MAVRSRWVLSAVGVVAFVIGAGAFLTMTNSAPRVPAISDADPPTSRQPYVIKLHSRWCPICMATKGAWATVQSAYTGKVRFVIFDFTDHETTEASRTRAKQLGLEPVFDVYEGETGTVLVLDGMSKEVRQALQGIRSQADYRAAIDASLDRVRND